jgi:hypothetical protein
MTSITVTILNDETVPQNHDYLALLEWVQSLKERSIRLHRPWLLGEDTATA